MQLARLVLYLSVLVGFMFVSSSFTLASIVMQNFKEDDLVVESGLEIYKYENNSTLLIDEQAEFNAQVTSIGQFEGAVADLEAEVAAPDFLRLNHYGDTPPNTNTVDWWDDDADSSTKYNWRYRKCFTLDHSAAGALNQTEYQIYLELDTSTPIAAGKMLSTAADIRFVDEDENILTHYVADDLNETSTRIWLQMDDITAGTAEEICMYYGYVPYLENPIPANEPANLSDRDATFSYSSPESLYYVVADSAATSVTEFASYSDSNSITVATYSDTLNEFEFADFPSSAPTLLQTTAISTQAPINGAYFSLEGSDALVPASAAGESFVYRMDRGTNTFSFLSPWCSANVEVRNENDLIVTSGTFTVAAGTASNLATTNNATTGIANDSAVIIEVTNGCPILVTHEAGGTDGFVLYPAATEWYGVGSGNVDIAALNDGTNVTVYRSNAAPATQLLNRGENFQINDTGSQGSDPAHRVVADQPIGVNAIADGDGNEAVTFLPVSELGYRYYIPQDAQYIAIATRAEFTTQVDLFNDATTCGVGAPDSTVSVTPTAADRPGKAYFGSTTNGVNIAAGACIVADQPIFAYYEYATNDDEHNIWNEKQNRQFVHPQPTQVTTATEIGTWKLGSATQEWTRRIPVTVTNNAATTIDEYQIAVDLSTVSDIFGLAQADGGDIRVAGVLGNGTDNQTYFLDGYDGSSTGTVWIKTGSIASSASVTYYIYFRPIDQFDILTVNPEFWYDAADVNGDGLDGYTSLGSLATWEDVSGNNNDATQGTAGNRPTAELNGINFTGNASSSTTGDYFDLPDVSAQTFFMVLDNTVDGAGGGIHGLFGKPRIAGQYVYLFSSTEALGYQVSFDGSVAEQGIFSLNGGGIVGPGENIGTGDFPSTQTVLFAQYQNPQDNWSLLGAFQNNPSQVRYRANLDMREVIGIDGTVTATQRNNVTTYLENKWGTAPAATSLTTTGDPDIFTTTALYPTYYVVDDAWTGTATLEIISFADGNQVNDSFSTQTLAEGEIDIIPFGSGVTSDDIFTATGPLAIKFLNDVTDAAIPISWAGTEFATRVDRGSDSFSLYAPYATASVQIQESSALGWTTLQTVSVPVGTVVTVAQDIVNGVGVKIIADQPILAFHRNDSNDSKVLYPTDQALDPGSGSYELYGNGTASIMIAATNPGTTNVTLYRSDNTSAVIALNAANSYVYIEAGGGSQGTALGYRVVADGPISATAYADADGGETVSFLPPKEFSDTYVLPSDAQYFSVVTKDPSVTCRVYDAGGVEVTTGPAGLDNLPPQTSGALSLPYPNTLHIGGADIGDGAFFFPGYSLQCTEPVYAFFEHHLDTSVTDETTWLTHPQARKSAAVQPIVEALSSVAEQGLYFASGFDSASTQLDPQAYFEFTIDGTSFTNNEHLYWNQLQWEEVLVDRAAENSVEQIFVEFATADAAPTCTAASYTFQAASEVTLSTVVDASPPFSSETTNVVHAKIPDSLSDTQCLRVRVFMQTGDEAYTPRLNQIQADYSIPTLLEDQLNNPTVAIAGNDGSSSADARVRILKVVTGNAGLTGSRAELEYDGGSNEGAFTNADFEFFEINNNVVVPQFDFPVFPGSATLSGNEAIFDAANEIALYLDHTRTGAATETFTTSFQVDVLNVSGPRVARDFTISIGGV